MVGDFSLNIANPITAGVFKSHGLPEALCELRFSTSGRCLLYCAGHPQAGSRLRCISHMPMFHMEHCVVLHIHVRGKRTTPIADALVRSMKCSCAIGLGSCIP